MRVAVAVPCTDKKRGARGAPGVRLRDVPAGLRLPERAERWAEMVTRDRSAAGALPLEDLYAGPGWAASRGVVDRFREVLAADVEGFVVSAGLGLQPVAQDGSVWSPYSATFGSGHPDSVANRLEGIPSAATTWWSLLGAQKHLGSATFAGLADSHSALVIVASTTYLRAVSSDLVDAAEKGLRVAAYSGSAEPLGILEPLVVRFDARARSVVPASDARAAADFVTYIVSRLAEEALDVQAAQRFIDGLLEGHEPPIRPRGSSASPDEVRAFIVAELEKNPSLRKSPLLRHWRDQGWAFEQKRFGELFDEVKRDLGAGRDPTGATRA